MIALNLKGYQAARPFYIGTRTLVYRAIRERDGETTIVKVLRNPHPNFNELAQFRNQYAIARQLDFDYILKPIALERHGRGYALILPETGALPLSDYWPQAPRTLEDFFAVALRLAEILDYLASQRIIHKDIKPANILIHPTTGQIYLIDFSIASSLPREQQQFINPTVLEGTLAYISPEQTGRMNRAIDYRTDFYSLGVTFFELLTGELPFVSDDPLELVYCHIATKVEFPVDSGVPEALQAVILKLMAKNAEDRYQSALGLKRDLEECLRQWQETGEIAAFELGQRDVCARFVMPEKLYGREAEVAQLLAAFDRVSGREQGTGEPNSQFRILNSELFLVAGLSGIGKTALINEIHKPIVRQRSYFISGKYDRFNRNIPLLGLVRSLQDLLAQLSAESDDRLQVWKTRVLEAVGENGRVLTEFIPELENLIGPQPPVMELAGAAMQERFDRLLQNFIALFAGPECPLVLFLDDLQWADAASLKLIELLVTGTQHLLVLGAYRSDEVAPTHALRAAIAKLENAGAGVNEITLAPLKETDLNRAIAESLHCSLKEAQPLTTLIARKTQGNPFYVAQLLKALHDETLLVFNRQRGCWECDLARVKTQVAAEDVVEFMAARLQKLSQGARELLELAACMGDRFDLATLAIAAQQRPERVAGALWSVLQEGLILPQSEVYKFYTTSDSLETQNPPQNAIEYRFLHDRVRQAAYGLIPDERKAAIHARIGQLLLQTIPRETRAERVFELVTHRSLISSLALANKFSLSPSE